MWLIWVLMLGVMSSAVAEESTKKHKGEEAPSEKRSISKDCENSFSATCMKLSVISWVDKFDENDVYSILPGVSLVREDTGARAIGAHLISDLAREFPNPDTRLNVFLLRKLQDFFNTHSVKLDLGTARKGGGGSGGGGSGGGGSGFGASGGGGGGGGGGKKGGGGGGGNMILAAGGMMASTMVSMAMAGLAALAGKALMTSLIALVLAALSALKGGGGGGGKTTYEVISKPVYTHSSSHSSGHEDYHSGGGGGGHGGWSGRSLDMPLPLGLQPEYKPT